ncbi:hypothetical protein BZG36_01701 [Bifiguratus adelaidae]|uniref:ABC transmembrane type-1 domain-containing protein n=1 Tax=Bifiguratus adelaidae TaxID=1938954 RepID=A0A261Y4Q4_9FUNG|nr:hypothetical protein BZG36_01701 [Bifiguratus adelaidae]
MASPGTLAERLLRDNLHKALWLVYLLRFVSLWQLLRVTRTGCLDWAKVVEAAFAVALVQTSALPVNVLSILTPWDAQALWPIVSRVALGVYVTDKRVNSSINSACFGVLLLLTYLVVDVQHLFQSSTLSWTRNYLVVICFDIGLICRQLLQSNKHLEAASEQDHPPDVEATASLVSRALFLWPASIFRLHHPIKATDIPSLPVSNRAATIEQRTNRVKQVSSSLSSSQLTRQLLYTFRSEILVQAASVLLENMLTSATQLSAARVIAAISAYHRGEALDSLKPFLLIGLTLGLGICRTAARQWELHMGRLMQIRVKAFLISQIHAIALRRGFIHSDTTRRGQDLHALIATDVDEVATYASHLFQTYSDPLQIILTMGILISILGPASLVGVLLLILMTYLARVMNARFAVYQNRESSARDARIHSTSEALRAIDAVKMFGMEAFFATKIRKARAEELAARQSLTLRVRALDAVATITPTVMIGAVFVLGTYTAHRDLSPALAFTAISLLKSLGPPLNYIPYSISSTQAVLFAIQKIERTLRATGDEPVVSDRKDKKDDMVGFVKDTRMIWDHWTQDTEDNGGQFALAASELTFPRGTISLVTGSTGSGKSMLLLSLLGQTKAISGQIHHPSESIAFVSQVPWIIMGNIKENIILHHHFDRQRYLSVTKSAWVNAARRSLAGKKKRIALARAMYSDARIVLIDDSFASIDRQTAKHIVRHCFGGPLLAGRTIVMVTHQISLCAPFAHQIIHLEGGQVGFVGPPSTMPSRLGSFESDHQEANATPMEMDTFQTPKTYQQQQTEKGNDEHAQQATNLGKAVDRSLYKQCFSLFGGFPFWVGLICVYGIVEYSITYQDWALKRWMAGMVSDSSTEAMMDKNAFRYFYVAGISVTLLFARSLFMKEGARMAARVIHNNLLDAILSVPKAFFDKTPVDRILSRFSSDMRKVDHEVPATFHTCFLSLSTIITVFVTISMTSLWAILPAACVVYGVFQFSDRYLFITRSLRRLEAEAQSELLTALRENEEGSIIIRAFGAEDYFYLRIREKLDNQSRSFFWVWSLNRTLHATIDIGSQLIQTMVSIAILAHVHRSDAATAGFYIEHSKKLGNYLLWIVRNIAIVEVSMTALECIQEYTTLEPEGNRPEMASLKADKR